MRMRRIAVYLSVCLAIILVVFIQTNKASAQTNFTDIDENDASYDEIQLLVQKGIIKGLPDGTFQPNASLTREDAATMIGRALNLEGTPQVTSFKDVNPKSYASGYIQELTKMNIITGYTDGTFQPKGIMKREEMAYLVSRAFSLNDVGPLLPYTDIIQDKPIYDPINKVTTAGITEGYSDGTYRPSKTITREEFALMVARAINPDFRIKDVSTTPIAQGMITATSLNVRQGPSTNYHSLGLLPQGTTVNILKKVAGWALISTDSLKGYVSSQYVRDSTDPLVGRIVTIDPGHGGTDPGAVSNGVMEKDINLAVSLKVASYLKSYGMNVIMTRSTDTYVGLQERDDISINNHAEAFLSIHSNSADASVDGTQTHYHVYTSTYDDPLTTQSIAFATAIQQSVVSMTGMDDRGVKTDHSPEDVGFHVLRENNVPCALIELGFITNANDVKKLTDPVWQDTAAKAIAQGIKTYFLNQVSQQANQ